MTYILIFIMGIVFGLWLYRVLAIRDIKAKIDAATGSIKDQP